MRILALKKSCCSNFRKSKTKNIESAFSEIIVPTEEVVEVKKEKREMLKENFFQVMY